MNRVTSFSIKKTDREGHAILADVQTFADNNGINFSFIVVQALKMYKEQVIEGKVR